MNTDETRGPGAGCPKCATNTVVTNNGNLAQVCELHGGVHFHGGDPQKNSVALLRAETDANLDLMARHLTLPIPGGSVEVERELFHDLAAAEGDFLITGDPGIGKSALIRRLAQHYRDQGYDVVLLDASHYTDRVGSRLALNLETVLADWPGKEPGHLFIDALDGDREGMAEHLARTVELLAKTRWRTVASVRLYDITHNHRWRTAFAGTPVAEEGPHRVRELDRVRHFRVTGFTGTELASAGTRVPGLGRVLTGAETDLLSNPFNLYLACELLSLDAWPDDWDGHLDQSALLAHYWKWRVMDEDRLARMKLLRELCDRMLDARRLQIGHEALESEREGVLDALVSNGVLRETTSPYSHGMSRFSFGHHIFFDYAVSQLVFSGGSGSLLVKSLTEQPNLVFVARPAIDLHLIATWHADPTRKLFSDVCLGLARTEHVLTGVAAANVAVGLARAGKDVDWLVSALITGEESAAEEAVGWVIGVLRGREERDTETRRAVVAVWTRVATALAHQLGADFRAVTVNLLHQLLRQLHELDALVPGASADRERAHCAAELMSSALEDTELRGQVAGMAVLHLPAAIAVEATHAALLRRIIRDEPTRRRNFDVFYWSVCGAVDIARGTPEIAAELLETVWDLKGSRDETTAMSHGVVSLSSNLAQDFESVRYQVGQVFPEVLPLIGGDAACRILAAATHEDYYPEAADRGRYPLRIQGESGHVIYSLARLENASGYRAPTAMLTALLDLAEQTGADGVEITVRHLVRHVWHPGVWMRVMERARDGGPAWYPIAVELLSSGALLANPVTRRTSADLLGALSLQVDGTEHGRLEDSVLAAAGIASSDPQQPDPRVIDELVSFLNPELLTRPPLIERLREVRELDEPPEVYFGGIVSGSMPLTPQERFGEPAHEELGEERMAFIDRLEDLTVRVSRSTDPQEWEELAALFLEAVQDKVLLARISPATDDAVAAAIVAAAERLARFTGATPGSELGQQIYRVMLLAIGQGPDAKEEEE